jgi:hypothetical protein
MLDIDQVIPGHGTPTKKWKEAFLKEQNYFKLLREVNNKFAFNQKKLIFIMHLL